MNWIHNRRVRRAFTQKAGVVPTGAILSPAPQVPGRPAGCTWALEPQGTGYPEKTRDGRAVSAAWGSATSPGGHVPHGKPAGRLDGSPVTRRHDEVPLRVKPADQTPVPLRAGSSRSSASIPHVTVLTHRVTGRRGPWMVMACLPAGDAGAHHTSRRLVNQQLRQRTVSNEGPWAPGPGHQQGGGCDSTWVSALSPEPLVVSSQCPECGRRHLLCEACPPSSAPLLSHTARAVVARRDRSWLRTLSLRQALRSEPAEQSTVGPTLRGSEEPTCGMNTYKQTPSV